MVFVFLFLTSLSMRVSSFIHVAANVVIYFVLFTAEYYSIVYIYHTFLIQSQVNGDLVGIHVLTIVNSAAMNIGVHIPF